MNACQRDKHDAWVSLMFIICLFMKNCRETNVLLTKNNRNLYYIEPRVFHEYREIIAVFSWNRKKVTFYV